MHIGVFQRHSTRLSSKRSFLLDDDVILFSLVGGFVDEYAYRQIAGSHDRDGIWVNNHADMATDDRPPSGFRSADFYALLIGS